jgi:hypothetical protein
VREEEAFGRTWWLLLIEGVSVLLVSQTVLADDKVERNFRSTRGCMEVWVLVDVRIEVGNLDERSCWRTNSRRGRNDDATRGWHLPDILMKHVPSVVFGVG